MSERAQALEALKSLARDIGTVDDIAGRRSNPDRDHQQMRARLRAWRVEILKALDILEAPAEGVSPQPDTPAPGWFQRQAKQAAENVKQLPSWLRSYPDHRLYECSDASKPAPVSPVEPTPEPPTATGSCDHDPRFKGVLFTKNGCLACECERLMAAPTGAPAPCVWRETVKGNGVLKPGCLSWVKPMNLSLVKSYEFTHCGHCGQPLTVER